MTILGIETSCDETALALIETKGLGETFECRIIQSLVHSQADLHSAYGGVYPTLAKREHSKNLVPLLGKLLKDVPNKKTGNDSQFKADGNDAFKQVLNSFRAEMTSQNSDLFTSMEAAEFLKNVPAIDKIAVTEGPGLEPTLWVGISFAQILGALWKIPVIPINHMEGHIIGSLLESDAPYGAWQKLKIAPLPAVALLISGGHTELIHMRAIGDYSILGQTKDDAVGEAYDKTARLLGLPYPGGPHIGKLAHEAREQNISAPVTLPRPIIASKDLDFSFSGLKTAVLYAVRKAVETDRFDDAFKKGLAREFEQAVADVLESKLRKACEQIGAQSIIVGGGVSANHFLRERFTAVAKEYHIPVFLPSRHISGDNALMISLSGALQGHHTDRELKAHGTKRLGKSE